MKLRVTTWFQLGFIMLFHVFFLFSAIDDMISFEEELNKIESFAADMRERDNSIEENLKGKTTNSATFLKQMQHLMFKIAELKSMIFGCYVFVLHSYVKFATF